MEPTSNIQRCDVNYEMGAWHVAIAKSAAQPSRSMVIHWRAAGSTHMRRCGDPIRCGGCLTASQGTT